MIYETRLTIPKSTVESAPAEASLPIHPGVLNRLEISFPPGPSGLAHLRVFYWERQLWPANPDSDFAGDDIQIVFDEDLEIIDPPYEFVLKGWNEDYTYPHTVTVRAHITPDDRDIRTILERLVAGPGAPLTVIEG